MSSIVAEITRGEVVESRHHGFIVAADGDGKIVARSGDVENCVTYMRSAAKPIQAINVIASGAADRFGFTDRELAIMCASHYGEEGHRQTVYGMLEKIGCSVSDLVCGATLSLRQAYMEEQLREKMPMDATCSDCSGKHCGFLAVCKLKGYPTQGYNRPDHPMQREVLHVMSRMSSVPEERIPLGVDGCSVPVHALPLINMAVAYARFSTPEQLEEPYRSACRRLYGAMNAHPWMVAGTGGFCTAFMENTGGRFCGKGGAEGIFCVGVKDRNLGIVVKIEDGCSRAIPPVVLSVLERLGLMGREELESLRGFALPAITNDPGDSVGRILPCFDLSLGR